MIEKSIKQKIENLKYLKSKFIIENKNGEKDPMFSEGVYSNLVLLDIATVRKLVQMRNF